MRPAKSIPDMPFPPSACVDLNEILNRAGQKASSTVATTSIDRHISGAGDGAAPSEYALRQMFPAGRSWRLAERTGTSSEEPLLWDVLW